MRVFEGAGEVRVLCRTLDWAATTLGPVEQWPVSLQTSVGIVLRTSFPMLLVWGPNRVQIYNDAYAAQIGDLHPEALGCAAEDSWPRLRQAHEPILARVLRGETVQIVEAQCARNGPAGADDAYFDASFAPVSQEDGAVGGVLCTLIESTSRVRGRAVENERARLMSELASERERLVAAQAVARVGSWQTDFATHTALWSDETFRIFGLDPASANPTHERFLEFLHPDDAERVDAAFVASFATREVCTIEHRIFLADGTVKDVEECWRTFVNAEGKPSRAVGTCQDITARRAADYKLRRLVTAVESLTEEAVSLIDESGLFLYTNATHAHILDYDAETAGAMNIDAFMPDDAARRETREILEQVRNGRSWRGMVRRKRQRDGQVVLMDIILGAIPEQERTLFFEIVSDATERLAREQHLRRVERVAGMGTLIAGVAHELNNPLSAIIGFVHLLQLEPHSDAERDDLATIDREAQRMAKIVSDLKLVARDTQGGAPLERVDVNDVVRHVMKTRAYSLATRNIEVRLDLAEELPAILGDRAQLEQALLNLVVNAEQAMTDTAAPSRRVIVRTRASVEGCAIHVVDSGSGISRDQLERIFDPFFTTKAPGEGTGLGLSLVQRIVNDHRGQIRVESEPGRGSAFRIDLPRAQAAFARTTRETPVPPCARRLRVLVVDDEDAVRRVVSRILSRRGHTVHEAAEGAAALALLGTTADAYDVIVSDLRMPGLGGDALIQQLKLRADDMARRVILMTGDTADADVMRWLTDADVPVLAKPIALAEVVRMVEKVGELALATGS